MNPSIVKSIIFEAIKYVISEYIALSQPKTKPALKKIKTLINKTTLPTEKDVFRLSRIPKISVPSREPPDLITIPTPTPKKAPPKIDASMDFQLEQVRSIEKVFLVIKRLIQTR